MFIKTANKDMTLSFGKNIKPYSQLSPDKIIFFYFENIVEEQASASDSILYSQLHCPRKLVTQSSYSLLPCPRNPQVIWGQDSRRRYKELNGNVHGVHQVPVHEHGEVCGLPGLTNHIILNFTTHQADFRAIRHKLQTCHLLFSYVVFEVRSFWSPTPCWSCNGHAKHSLHLVWNMHHHFFHQNRWLPPDDCCCIEWCGVLLHWQHLC